MLIFYTFMLGLFCTLVQIPAISRLAISIGVLDKTDDRKIHRGEIPRLGGIAIFSSVFLAVLLFSSLDGKIRAYLTGGIIIFLVGLTDDLQGLTSRQKFIGEFIAATVTIVIGDLSITSIGNLFGSGELLLGQLSLPFTIVALVGVINAVNLIDGLDGLAGGITAIASLGFLVFAWLSGNLDLVYVLAALIGATLGFLKYNTHPAQIFMGDSGSLFLGYSLGFSAINLAVMDREHISPVIPLIVLALPIFDTIVVMIRRKRNGAHFFSPDKNHLHHRLLSLGFNHRQVVGLLYAVSYCLVIGAFFSYAVTESWLFLGLLVCLACGYLNLWLMEREYAELGSLRFFSIKFPSLKVARNSRLHRLYVLLSRIAKYLLVGIFCLTMSIPPVIKGNLAIISVLLIAMIWLVISMRTDQRSRFLYFIIYFSGAFVVYLMQHYTRGIVFAGVPVLTASSIAFGMLFLAVLALITIRGNPAVVISTPLEYLIIFLVISVPLLPEPFRQRYDLLMVSAKSVVLFIALKLVLKPTAYRNRKIILAALASLIVIIIRNLFSL